MTVLDYKSDPANPMTYAPAVGALDFGDVLVRQSQLLEQEKTPVGRTTDALTHAIGCASVGGTLIGGVVTMVQPPQCALNRLDLAPESFTTSCPT